MSANGGLRAAALRRLDVLVGRWETEPLIEGGPALRSHTVFEWVEDGAFLRQRADVDEPPTDPTWRENSPFPITAIIGLDDSADTFTMLYSDGRGVFRVYRMTVADGVWRQWREAPGFHQRFTGRISEDGATITGMWEFSSDGESWGKDFDLVYRRTG
jgi:hypothetical protein